MSGLRQDFLLMPVIDGMGLELAGSSETLSTQVCFRVAHKLITSRCLDLHPMQGNEEIAAFCAAESSSYEQEQAM
jgi:hypothetical protein